MRKKIKITSDFNKRLERLFSSEKDILLDIISIIGSVDYDYLYQNRTFTTTPIILNKLTNKEDIPLLPVWQNENTINLFVNKRYQNIVAFENENIKFKEDPDPQRFVGIFFCLHGKDTGNSFSECILGDKRTDIYTDGCVYYFVNVYKIMNDYFNHQKLSTLEKIMVILGLDDQEEMKRVAGENKKLIKLIKEVINDWKTRRSNKRRIRQTIQWG